MTKKERIRLLLGVAVMAVIFIAVAAIGWTKDEFTITYYYGFDEKYETAVVKKGYVKEPLTPGRYGYVFDGWYYTDKQGNEIPFDFEYDRITTDMNLTAHWIPHETEVNLYYYVYEDYVYKETVHLDPVLVKYGEEYELPSVDFDGLYFYGWQSLYGNKLYTSGVWTLPVAEFKLRGRFGKFKPGQTFFIGVYKQNKRVYNSEGNVVGWEKEPIEWIPIDKKDGKYLLVSKYSLDAVSLHKADKGFHHIPWADCLLREWLNTEFYNTVFTDEEKLLIQDSYDPELGTTDKVFLLSREEGELLIGFDEYGAATSYAWEAGLDEVKTGDDEHAAWLTRSCDNGQNWVMHGSASPLGIYALRPAIWVDAAMLMGW